MFKNSFIHIILVSLLSSTAGGCYGYCWQDADFDGAYAPYGGTTPLKDCKGGDEIEVEDCDDENAEVNPEAEEICDGIDNDCDGEVDESDAADAVNWYPDYDGDGYGNQSITSSFCIPPDGYVSDATDCDDTEAAVNPRATEVCDNVDNNCDGQVDEGVTVHSWYQDTDGDEYGNLYASTEACYQPKGYVFDITDCDDTDASVNPDATEVCDGIDNDCDNVVDEPDAADAATWYADSDDDDFGDSTASIEACNQPTGYVSNSTDCDDTSAVVYPGAPELCDGIDNDCDPEDVTDRVDEYVTAVDWYEDTDSDGYGGNFFLESCKDYSSEGYIQNNEDCDDTNASVNPAATEYCDSIDNDCDSEIDESDAADAATWFADFDGDGYGNDTTSTESCDKPSGYVADATDCDDTEAAVNPGEAEVCDDGLDNDCDDEVDTLNDENVGEGDLVISEIMADPNGFHSQYQWVEIFNPTACEVNMEGLVFSVTSGSASITSLVIDPYDYVVLGVSSSAAPTVDFVYSTASTITMSDGSDTVEVATSGGLVVDLVSYTSSWPYTTGYSMGLDPGHMAADENDDTIYWCQAVSAYTAGGKQHGTPGTVNDDCGF